MQHFSHFWPQYVVIPKLESEHIVISPITVSAYFAIYGTFAPNIQGPAYASHFGPEFLLTVSVLRHQASEVKETGKGVPVLKSLWKAISGEWRVPASLL